MDLAKYGKEGGEIQKINRDTLGNEKDRFEKNYSLGSI
jgi:hypothetical protein